MHHADPYTLRLLTSLFALRPQIFSHACGTTLDRMPSTLQQDERLLREQKDLSQRMQDSIHLRLGHKHLLQGCVAQADAALFFLDTLHQAALQPTQPVGASSQRQAEL